MLAAYLVPFSWAYTRVQAGSGALLLFGAVQSTLLVAGLRGGERLVAAQWCGMALALAGLGLLVGPGLEAPPPAGALAMAIAGVAWGFYTLRGRRARDPLAATTANFVAATPFVAAAAVGAALVTAPAPPHAPGRAARLASGALASALGYVAWYAALPRSAPPAPPCCRSRCRSSPPRAASCSSASRCARASCSPPSSCSAGWPCG